MPLRTVNASEEARSLENPRGRVDVHIDELILHGFAPADRRAIADAVQVQLAKLMREAALPASRENELEFQRIDAGTFQIKHGSKAESSGAQIARSVVRGLRKQMRAAARPAEGRAPAGGGKR